MYKVIGIIEKYNSNYDSCLRLFDKEKNIWEWDNIGFSRGFKDVRDTISIKEYINKRGNHIYDEPFSLNVTYNTLDADGLKSYIEAFERILMLDEGGELVEFPVNWLTNEANFRIRARKADANEIELEIKCINKFRLIYDEFYMGAFGGGVPEEYGRDVISDYNGKPDEYSKAGSSEYPIENIQEYLENLIEEYEKEIGEKYERIDSNS